MQTESTRAVFLLLSGILIALLMGMMATQFSPTMVIWGALGLAVFIAAFIKNEFGLYILIFSMLLSPEFIVGTTEGATLGRGVTLRLDDFLLLVIGFSWFAKTSVHKELGLFLKTPLNRPIFLYLAVCIVSTGMGIMAGRADVKTGFFFVLKYFEYFIVYFMVANYLDRKEQVNRFLLCLFLTCFLVSLYGMIQIPGGGRVSAPFEGEIGEPNTFGGYLLFILAVAAGLYMKMDNHKIKRWLLVLLITIVPPLLFTQSRSTYLGLIPAVVVLALKSERKLLVMSFLGIFLIASPFVLPSEIKDRVMYTFRQPKEYGQITIGEIRLDTSASDRLVGWQQAAIETIKHPFFGHGVTGFRFLDAQFPKVFAETGIFGLSAFIYLLFSIYRFAEDNLQHLKTPYYIGLTNGFIAGFIGLLFHSIGTNTFIIVRIMEPFWLVAGIVALLPELEEKERIGANLPA